MIKTKYQQQTISREPRAAGHEPRVMSHEPRVTSHESRATGRESRVTSREPRVTSHEPRVTGHESRVTGHGPRNTGSALILTVVLTSLLALIGIMFIMMARVDRMATSAISENRELNFAVDAVVDKISQELISDVPGVAGQEYYDYPDSSNAWLASLEPYLYSDNSTSDTSDDIYKWRQISDLTGYIRQQYINGRWGNWLNSSDQNDVQVNAAGYDENGNTLSYYSGRQVMTEYPEITLDNDGVLYEQWADADGDGIADSKWIALDGVTSDKGKPIYAAVRIVDNGGMLNVNTAYQFNPGSALKNEIDGSSQMQIDLESLARAVDTVDTIAEIDANRNPGGRTDSQYQDEFIWRIEDPCFYYRPFDISDELELRYRFCITSQAITRLENAWNETIGIDFDEIKDDPYAGGTFGSLAEWCAAVTDPFDPCNFRRHYLSTYNIDRIIDPAGNKMVDINDFGVNINSLYSAIKAGLYDDGITDLNSLAAQITVNLIDFRDNDANAVTSFPVDGITYYGFERPCVYISELTRQFQPPSSLDFTIADINMSYAIELYKPYTEDGYPQLWQLTLDGYPGSPVTINWTGTRRFHVIVFEAPGMTIAVPPAFDGDPDPVIGPPSVQLISIPTGTQVFWPPTAALPGSIISLQRPDGSGGWITVDSIQVPTLAGWMNLSDTPRSIRRDINTHKCIRRLWANSLSTTPEVTLGNYNSYNDPRPDIIQAHPENRLFTNVGEIGILLRKSAYSQGPNSIGPTDTEVTARLNLADPCYQNLFQYLTCFDPTNDGIDNDGDGTADELSNPPVAGDELKVPGRININTAPWFVLAQLPWLSNRGGGFVNDPCLAQAIVAYRDKLDLSSVGGPDYYHGGAFDSRETETGINELRNEPGFASIGELATVINNNLGQEQYSMDYYTLGTESGIDLPGFPDLTTPDGLGPAADDFEERDVIFARISNLVTVRSDVFTAYILVRIGRDGPQKRVVAILDRSNVYPAAGGGYTGKVRILAIHPVPDPR